MTIAEVELCDVWTSSQEAVPCPPGPLGTFALETQHLTNKRQGSHEADVKPS